jgi:hypothetical protein
MIFVRRLTRHRHTPRPPAACRGVAALMAIALVAAVAFVPALIGQTQYRGGRGRLGSPPVAMPATSSASWINPWGRLLIGHGGREVLPDGAPPGATEHPKPRLSCKNVARSGSNKGLRWR